MVLKIYGPIMDKGHTCITLVSSEMERYLAWARYGRFGGPTFGVDAHNSKKYLTKSATRQSSKKK